jgi:hypothetical protein
VLDPNWHVALLDADTAYEDVIVLDELEGKKGRREVAEVLGYPVEDEALVAVQVSRIGVIRVRKILPQIYKLVLNTLGGLTTIVDADIKGTSLHVHHGSDDLSDYIHLGDIND